MSFIIVGKAAGASIGLCLVAVSGLYMVSPATIDHWIAPLYSAEVYGFLKDTVIEASSSTNILSVAADKWTCQIDSIQFECTVKEVNNLTDEKKHILLKDFLTRSDKDRVLKEEKTAFTSKKLYQIKDIELNFKNREWQTKPIKVSHTSGSTTTELGSITSMFMLQGRSTTFAGKTTSFIGQASDNLGSTTSYKCSWAATSPANDLKECKIYPFVENDSETQHENTNISKLTFKSSSTEASEIKKNHYYLIQFTNEADVAPTIEKFDQKTLVYVKDGSSSGADKVIFKKLSAVTVVGEQLLILKKHQEA